MILDQEITEIYWVFYERKKRMIIDAHQHFWNKDILNYPWLTPDIKELYRNFLPVDLEPLVKQNNVYRTVVVQATSSYDETDYLIELAEKNVFIGAVVGWVDLKQPDLEDVLSKLAKHKKLKGIRHQIEDEPDREWLIRPDVLRGLARVARSNYVFDALLKHDQLWQLKVLNEKVPELNVVIDHAAKPNIARSEFKGWADDMRAAAKLPVYCKISGLLTEANHDCWKPCDFQRYVDCILDAFGTDRVMFGSDWPVSTMAADYHTSVETISGLLDGLSPDEKEKIMFSNAKSFYAIE